MVKNNLLLSLYFQVSRLKFVLYMHTRQYTSVVISLEPAYKFLRKIILRLRVGWVERLFAKPIILHEVDGFHYASKKQALQSTHPTKMLN